MGSVTQWLLGGLPTTAKGHSISGFEHLARRALYLDATRHEQGPVRHGTDRGRQIRLDGLPLQLIGQRTGRAVLEHADQLNPDRVIVRVGDHVDPGGGLVRAESGVLTQHAVIEHSYTWSVVYLCPFLRGVGRRGFGAVEQLESVGSIAEWLVLR